MMFGGLCGECKHVVQSVGLGGPEGDKVWCGLAGDWAGPPVLPCHEWLGMEEEERETEGEPDR